MACCLYEGKKAMPWLGSGGLSIACRLMSELLLFSVLLLEEPSVSLLRLIVGSVASDLPLRANNCMIYN